MTLTGFLLLLLVATIAGSLGQAISGYSVGGCIVSIIVGFVGAFIGMWLANQFGLRPILPITINGEAFPIVWSVIGSTLLSAVLGLLVRRRGIV
jgi:uncharacterized membrane protein YeaQ/YmgE (transglycosylase-associated protein family)